MLDFKELKTAACHGFAETNRLRNLLKHLRKRLATSPLQRCKPQSCP